MSKEIPMITLVAKGSKTFPRYVLAKADEFKNAVYWDGSTWGDESEAVLFNNVNKALWTQHDLLMEFVSDRPCHQYVTPLYIEIYGDRPKLADLREWLEKAVRIVVESPKHGRGPNDTFGVVLADVDETKSV